MVRVRGLRKSYTEAGADHVILDGVDGEIAPAEFVALLGRSGSGKSTLLNLVAGLDMPDAGEVWIGEQRIDALSEHDRTLFRRRHIGFVFQFFNLIPTLTVAENLQLPLELARPEADAAAITGRLLEEIGLGDRAAAFPDRLSGGEQQRVAIARALSHDPDLIIADEPTGNLDLDTGEQVLELLERMARDRGRTMLMATHSHEVAARADRRWRIVDGHLETEADAGANT
jgi:putative ABC transport system ATP-binding protein